MTDRGPSLVRNMVMNFGGFATSVVVALLLAPIMLGSLGDQRYGVWSLVGQLTGYYGLLDLGIRGAVSYFAGRTIAMSQHDRLAAYTATAFWGLAAIGGIVLMIGLAFVAALPYVFDLEGVGVAEARLTTLILSCSIALGFPMATFSAYLVGARRLDLVHAVEVSVRVVGAFVIYYTLTHGGRLVALALIQTGTTATVWALNAWLVFRRPGASLRPRDCSKVALKDLAGYGSKQTVMNLAGIVIERTDLIVIGVFVGVTGVTYYNIGGALVHYAWSACTAFLFAFTPHMTQMHARGEEKETIALLIRGTRLVSYFACGLTACMLAFGDRFIGLWLGERFVTGDLTWRSDFIMALLLMANLPRMLFGVSRQLLFATARQTLLAWMMTAEAIANLVLSLALVGPLGLVGVALGTLIPQIVTQMVIMPRYVLRVFAVPARDLLVRGMLQPVVVAGIVYLLARPIAVYADAGRSWLRFGASAAATAALAGAIVWFLGLDRAERRLFLDRFRPPTSR